MSKKRTVLLVAVLAIIALLYLLTPARLAAVTGTPALPDDLDGWLASAESAASYPLVPGTEKQIRWNGPAGQRTPYAIVYLHGFSASRQEIAPTMDIVADAVGANLFETRLSGHGRAAGALENVAAEQWLADAAEALAIGARIGDEIILVGTSTGATLAMAMASHELMQSVSHVVLISPNFGLNDARASLLTKPAGPQLADLLIGDTRSFEVRNERHGRYWSPTYPTRAIVEAMRLVDYVDASLPLSLPGRLLVMYSPDDEIISTAALDDTLARIASAEREVVRVTETDDPMRHVIAGDILSPSTTQSVATTITTFILGDAAGAADTPDEEPTP